MKRSRHDMGLVHSEYDGTNSDNDRVLATGMKDGIPDAVGALKALGGPSLPIRR